MFDDDELGYLGGIDFSGFDNLDLSSLLGDAGPNFLSGDYGSSLGDELKAALQDSGNASSLFSGDGGIDLSSLMEGVGDFDQAAPPANIADLLKNITTGEEGSSELLTPGGVNESFLDNLSPEERKRYQAMQEDDYKTPTYGVQDLGISQEMMDEFNQNFNPAGGFGSQWQTVGTNRVMVNDDGTSTILNPTTGETSYLTEEQTTALVNNGTLNSANSGYVAATGGKGDIPGGGKTVINKDGTKTVTTTDGKTYVIEKDGTVRDITKIIGGGGGGGGNVAKPADKKDNNMLMMLLALMALMSQNKGGSSGSTATIPSLTADRKQLPYGQASGSTARPGAGGVQYFTPTTYSTKAAGGGMMYGGGGISDLGGYSDGGRLLKGPGDGVSDSIPATIGGKQPARLAEGEFVVPARIVSELGNGSTQAGAQRLYGMMDRVQNARRKTKNVAADTKAHKYLPA